MAIDKLLLQDSSITVEKESSAALGMGFRCGFLGLLHMDVFCDRLEEEFGARVIITAPTVRYKVVLSNGKEMVIENPNEFPSPEIKFRVLEPMVNATIITPKQYLGVIMELCRVCKVIYLVELIEM